tara:strand:- start:750 stop:944 length:195 start_codon:yes stop_codon:yes gene_type:complete
MATYALVLSTDIAVGKAGWLGDFYECENRLLDTATNSYMVRHNASMVWHMSATIPLRERSITSI